MILCAIPFFIDWLSGHSFCVASARLGCPLELSGFLLVLELLHVACCHVPMNSLSKPQYFTSTLELLIFAPNAKYAAPGDPHIYIFGSHAFASYRDIGEMREVRGIAIY